MDRLSGVYPPNADGAIPQVGPCRGLFLASPDPLLHEEQLLHFMYAHFRVPVLDSDHIRSKIRHTWYNHVGHIAALNTCKMFCFRFVF